MRAVPRCQRTQLTEHRLVIRLNSGSGLGLGQLLVFLSDLAVLLFSIVIDADVHTVVLLLGKDNDDADDDDDAVIMTKVIARVHPVHLMGLGLGSSRRYGMIWCSKCQFI